MPPITPMLVVLVLGAIAAFNLIVALVLLVLSRRIRVRITADERYRTRTQDGWTITLWRWRAPPAAEGAPKRRPVILCHGLGADALEFDLAEHVSLARTLRARGFDVWAVDLRGGRGSTPPPGTRPFAFSMDQHIDHDVPAAIELVKRETGAEKVAWVGHSMGGILIYGHAEATAGRDLACAVTIGSPAGFPKRPSVSRWGSRLLPWFPLDAIHQTVWARLLAPLSGYASPRQVRLLLNPDNAEGWVMRTGMASCLVDIPVRILRQLDAWVATGRFVSEDGRRVYFERLGEVRTPWLAIAGAGDKLVRWQCARVGFDAIGSERKSWLLCGVAQGHAADYGHCDLVMGRRSAADVYPPIVAFLEEHAVEKSEVRGSTFEVQESGGTSNLELRTSN